MNKYIVLWKLLLVDTRTAVVTASSKEEARRMVANLEVLGYQKLNCDIEFLKVVNTSIKVILKRRGN